MGTGPVWADAEARLSDAAAEFRRWPADHLAGRQQLNDRVGQSLEQLATSVRTISEQLSGLRGRLGRR